MVFVFIDGWTLDFYSAFTFPASGAGGTGLDPTIHGSNTVLIHFFSGR